MKFNVNFKATVRISEFVCVRVTLELYGWCQDLDILTYSFSESYNLFQNNFFSQRSKAEVRIQTFSVPIFNKSEFILTYSVLSSKFQNPSYISNFFHYY